MPAILRRLLVLIVVALALAACTSAPAAQPASTPTSAAPLPQRSPVAGEASPSPLSSSPPRPAASPSPSPSPRPLAVVRLGMRRPSAGHWPLLVAERKGMLDSHGLAAQFSWGQVPEDLVDGLSRGSYDAVVLTAEEAIAAAEAGRDVKIVGGLLNRAVYHLIAEREVSSYSDLNGRPLAVSDMASSRTVLLRRLLARQQLSEADYSLVEFPTAETRHAALVNGTVAGVLVEQPDAFRFLSQRFRSLGLTTDVTAEYQAEVLVAGTRRSNHGDDTLVRLVRAVGAASSWIYDTRNRHKAASILATAAQVSPADGAQTYDLLVDRLGSLSRDGAPNAAGLRTVTEYMGQAGSLNSPLPTAERHVDMSVVERAKR